MTGQEFRDARSRLGMTQTELGQAMGVSLSAIQKAEAGCPRHAYVLAVECLERRLADLTGYTNLKAVREKRIEQYEALIQGNLRQNASYQEAIDEERRMTGLGR